MSILDEVNVSRRKRLPVITSAEVAECGLACLAMIGAYHGHAIDLNGLRQRFALSNSGATLRSLMSLADQLSLSTRALRVELEALKDVTVPAILHWDLNHFVVLKSVSRHRAVVHDPIRGSQSLTIDELSKHFTGIALELTPTAPFRQITARAPVRLTSLWSKAHGLWPAFFQALALSLALQVCAFAAPFQLQLVIDEAIGRADRDLLGVIAIGFVILAIFQAAIEALRGWTLQVFGQILTFQLVGNLVRHLLRLPSSFFEKRHIGDIMSRIGSSAAIQEALTRGLVAALIDGAMALAAAAILFVYSPFLAAIVAVSLAAILGLSWAFYPLIRARTEERLVASAKEQSHLMESVRGASTIKLMGREAERKVLGEICTPRS